MPAELLRVLHLVKRFGGLAATDDVSLEIFENEVHAIIGPNGAGKTTLVSQISGEISPTAGRIVFNGEDITSLSAPERAMRGIARSCQIVSIFPDLTPAENVGLAVQARAGHSFRFWRDARSDLALRRPALEILESVGVVRSADVPAYALSHGDQRLLELAIALAMHPRLWVLDEPMAGMGHGEAQRLISFLAAHKRSTTMLLIEHDMDAVFRLSDRITVLAFGRVIASGAPDDVRRDPKVRAAYLGEAA